MRLRMTICVLLIAALVAPVGGSIGDATMSATSAVGPGPSIPTSTGKLSGTVTFLGKPAPNIGVSVFSYEGGGYATTDANGDYTVTGLASNDYAVSFGGSDGVGGELFNDIPWSSGEDPTLVHVDDGATTAGINADLALAELFPRTCTQLEGWCIFPQFSPCIDGQISGLNQLTLANACDDDAMDWSSDAGHALSGDVVVMDFDGPGPWLITASTPSEPSSADVTFWVYLDLTLEDPAAEVETDAGVTVDIDGNVHISMPTGSPQDATLTVMATCPGATPTSVTLRNGVNDYPMTSIGGDEYQATVPGDAAVSGDLVVIIDCPGDGDSEETIGSIVLYDPSGYITNSITGDPIQNVTVSLYNVAGWTAKTSPTDNAPDTCQSNNSKPGGEGSAPWDQPAPTDEGMAVDPGVIPVDPAVNPMATDVTGYYGWDVPAGCWYVIASKPGYETLISPVVGVPTEVTDLDLELTPAPLPQFRDVPDDHTFHDDIVWMAVKGVTTGYDDLTYRPADAVSRQSMAAFLYRLSGSPRGEDPTCTEAPFPDVPADHLFCGEIDWMVDEGVTGGFTDGTFKPTQTISRQSMAAFLYRLAGSPNGEEPTCTEAPFPDVPANHLFCGEIDWMADAGVTGGFADGMFKPTLTVSRGSMAAFMHRFDDIPN